MQAGFSVISAENVCVPNKKIRNQNAEKLITEIEKKIIKKILSIHPPFQPVFFTTIPKPTPLQKILDQHTNTSENCRRYFIT